MPYAEGRTYYDADSHLMELGDWLEQLRRSRTCAIASGRSTSAARAPSPTKPSARPRTDAGIPSRPRELEAERDGSQGLECARRVRSGGTQPRARPARVRLATRVQHVRADPVPVATTSSSSTAGRVRTTARWSSSVGDDRRLIAVGFVSARRSRSSRGRRPRKRSRWAAVRSSCRRCRRATGRRRIPTTGRSGACSRRAASRSCCTSAAADGPCGAPSTRTGSRPSPTSSAAARTSGRRTTWSCTIRRRRSSRAWRSTASSSSSPACAAAASSRARCGSSTCCAASTSPQATFQKTEPALRPAARSRASTSAARCSSRPSRPSPSAG